MVAGPRTDCELLQPVLTVIVKVFFIGEKPGMGQAMNLANICWPQVIIPSELEDRAGCANAAYACSLSLGRTVTITAREGPSSIQPNTRSP
jgi:hypothetical protein